MTFQQFRWRLARLMDKVLYILDTNPDYGYFMLDGQTIVLEDYLEVRPERRPDIERHVRSGRLLIGPWYILPDQFLVSGESHIQNMFRGQRIAAGFGGAMQVGYIPDPFGQISQMPQILRGFGIDTAAFWRGVGKDINQIEFVWVAPDGSRVYAAHMAGTPDVGGYSTGLGFLSGVGPGLAQLDGVRDTIITPAKSGYALIMNGNDHTDPVFDTPERIRLANEALRESSHHEQMRHATLPQYFASTKASGIYDAPATPQHKGEFRDSQRSHLLPGVISTRMWIKQANTRIENLLERWAGPGMAWAWSLGDGTTPIAARPDIRTADELQPDTLCGLYDTAWKFLLQNQPHDSIPGCGIDQVHEEMRPRYAQAEQIGEMIVGDTFRQIAANVDTADTAAILGDDAAAATPILLFNPLAFRRSDVARISVPITSRLSDYVVVDADSTVLPHIEHSRKEETLFALDVPGFMLEGLAAQGGVEGRFMDYTMADYNVSRTADDPTAAVLHVTAAKGASQPTDPDLMTRALEDVQRLTAEGVENYKISIVMQTTVDIEFVAPNVPGCGYKTVFLRPRHAEEKRARERQRPNETTIENEFYHITANGERGTLTVTDKETGAVYENMHQWRDMADAGDEYNFSPPDRDTVISKPYDGASITVFKGVASERLVIEGALDLPIGLSADREERNKDFSTLCPFITTVSLRRGVKRIDFETNFDNKAKDHRLQVLFPAPFETAYSHAESAFDVVTRPVVVPPFSRDDYIEDPMPQHPQKTFVNLTDKDSRGGLTLINVGLPEYEALPPVTLPDGTQSGTTLALTLLRCVGWLSRDDLKTRRNHAGPAIETPGAQMLGEWVFRYSLMPHAGGWLNAGAQMQAHAANHPLRGFAADLHAGALAAQASMVEVSPRGIVLSTIKRSEDGAALIVRLWNPSNETGQVRVRFYRPPTDLRLVNLAETDTLESLTTEADGWAAFVLRGKGIATLRVNF